MATIAVIGTLDSKGHEHAFVADLIHKRGHTPVLIDLGTGTDPQVTPDITRFQVAKAAGLDLQPLIDQQDRGQCVVAMSKAAPVLLAQLVADKKIDGVISLGGGGGTALGTAAMRALPIGFPKLMVSTLASGNTAHYLGTKDITMMPSIVDVAGLNSISKVIFSRAAGAICGMVETEVNFPSSKPQRTTVSSPIDKTRRRSASPSGRRCPRQPRTRRRSASPSSSLACLATPPTASTLQLKCSKTPATKSLFFTPLAPAEKPWSRSSKAAW